jgi:hypothetical protein
MCYDHFGVHQRIDATADTKKGCKPPAAIKAATMNMPTAASQTGWMPAAV